MTRKMVKATSLALGRNCEQGCSPGEKKPQVLAENEFSEHCSRVSSDTAIESCREVSRNRNLGGLSI